MVPPSQKYDQAVCRVLSGVQGAERVQRLEGTGRLDISSSFSSFSKVLPASVPVEEFNAGASTSPHQQVYRGKGAPARWQRHKNGEREGGSTKRKAMLCQGPCSKYITGSGGKREGYGGQGRGQERWRGVGLFVWRPNDARKQSIENVLWVCVCERVTAACACTHTRR